MTCRHEVLARIFCRAVKGYGREFHPSSKSSTTTVHSLGRRATPTRNSSAKQTNLELFLSTAHSIIETGHPKPLPSYRSTMESSRGPPRVKNKAAAPIQISAEQLLREAVDRQDEKLKAPTQRFADLEELHEFQGRKRKEFEDYVRRNRINMNNWMRYAQCKFLLAQRAIGRWLTWYRGAGAERIPPRAIDIRTSAGCRQHLGPAMDPLHRGGDEKPEHQPCAKYP